MERENPSLFDKTESGAGGMVATTPRQVAGGLDVNEMTPNQLVLVEKVTKANIERLISDAEAFVEFSKRVRKIALSNTNNNDWCVFGDKPFLCEGGVKKTLSLIGASIRNTDFFPEEVRREKIKRLVSGKVMEDPDFKVGYFTVKGEIHFNGRVATNVGTASTKDDFFARRKKDGSPYYLDYDEVDKNNVKKKAVTNLSYRLLEMVLKLNPTLAELKEAGITPAGKVQFATGTEGGSTDSKSEKDKRTYLKTVLAKIAADTGRPQADILKEVTAFDSFKGYTNPDRVSSKALNITIEKLDKFGMANQK